MFEFIGEIKDFKQKEIDYRYQNYGGKVAVVQGHKDILLLDQENIVLKLKSGELSIKGKDLSVNEFCSNSIVIKGQIFSIERVGA